MAPLTSLLSAAGIDDLDVKLGDSSLPVAVCLFDGITSLWHPLRSAHYRVVGMNCGDLDCKDGFLQALQSAKSKCLSDINVCPTYLVSWRTVRPIRVCPSRGPITELDTSRAPHYIVWSIGLALALPWDSPMSWLPPAVIAD